MAKGLPTPTFLLKNKTPEVTEKSKISQVVLVFSVIKIAEANVNGQVILPRWERKLWLFSLLGQQTGHNYILWLAAGQLYNIRGHLFFQLPADCQALNLLASSVLLKNKIINPDMIREKIIKKVESRLSPSVIRNWGPK